MTTIEWQNMTISILLLVLIALLFISGLLMWTQHGRYHNQSMEWMAPNPASSAQSMTEPNPFDNKNKSLNK